MAKASIAGLLVIALAASGLFLVQRRRQPAPMPTAESLVALLPRDAAGFASAHAPWRFRFPADHAAHPDSRTESWQFSGSVSTAQGRRFGFQLTFFRIGVNPPATSIGPSAWATRDVYWAQFALTDVAANGFHAFERFARAAMGMSGSEQSPVRVWLEDWVMEVREADRDKATFHLRAAADDFRIELSLRNAKPPVMPAAGGATFHAYLMTRLIVDGTIRIDEQVFDVEGHAWLDRAWGLVPVPLGPVVWDRFSLQFDNGRELMGVQVRRRDGSGAPVVTGMLVERDGSTRMLPEGAVAVDVLDYWSSPYDGTRFPAQWRVRIAGEGSELYLVPYVAAQERRLSVRSWAGTVRISGMVEGQPIQGDGYVDVAGYDHAGRRP